jgi:tRNA 2-thiouridine synthesizing protein A
MHPKNPKAADVIAHVDRCWGARCTGCPARLIGHDAVLGMLLGYADRALCTSCLANAHGRERLAFLEQAQRNVRRLDCYRAGWRHADERLAAEGPWPEALVPARLRMPVDDDERLTADVDRDASDALGEVGTPKARSAASTETELERALESSSRVQHWDAGDRGCGELALELKLRIRRLEPGTRLLLRTTDLGAPADLPAWCRLTGNVLVAAAPPRFLIEPTPLPS